MSLKALYAAATGMDAQQARVDDIANNLSNVNTTGFKASRESFEDLFYDQVQTPGSNTGTNTLSPVGIQIGHGTRLVGVYKHFSQGEFSQTNRELDVGIEGNGFLPFIQEDGTTAYTRDGSLSVDASGNLVTKKGLLLSPTITIPSDATSITIAKDGTVSSTVTGQASASTLGKIQLAIFPNAAGLKSLGQNLFSETAASGTATLLDPGVSGAGTLSQGFLENSNVNVAEELINMIVAQRVYEANSKVMTTTNEMLRTSNSVI